MFNNIYLQRVSTLFYTFRCILILNKVYRIVYLLLYVVHEAEHYSFKNIVHVNFHIRTNKQNLIVFHTTDRIVLYKPRVL